MSEHTHRSTAPRRTRTGGRIGSLPRVAVVAAILCLVGGLGACGGDPPAPDPATAQHDTDHGHGAHVHKAPHGGTLVILSAEFAHVEFVLDGGAGRLTAYVLGAHAATPIRIAQPTIELTVGSGASELKLSLDAVGSALTGETPGDTSEFTVQHDGLRELLGFDGVLHEITARGETFRDVPVHLH